MIGAPDRDESNPMTHPTFVATIFENGHQERVKVETG